MTVWHNTMTIPLVKNAFYDDADTRAALARFVVSSDRLSMGERCLLFEREFFRLNERQHNVLVNSGSSANLLLIQALMNLGRFRPGDVIGVSAITWPTNVMPLIQLGLAPLVIDVDLETLNLSLDALYRTTPKMRGLFVTHALGMSANNHAVRNWCRASGVYLMEDACEALGTRDGVIPLGAFGDAATFSFFVGHQLSTIEGGMVGTDDYELGNQLLMARAHGWSRDLRDSMRDALAHGEGDELYRAFHFHDLGYNVRPTEITGFLGCRQYGQVPAMATARSVIFSKLSLAAAGNDDLLPLHPYGGLRPISALAFPVVCRTAEVRQRLIERAGKMGVEIRPIIGGNIARQPFWAKHVTQAWNCPNADFIHDHGFYFTCRPDLMAEEIDTLCELVGP